MSHGTRISNTNYGISARKVRVNSTNYSISSGKTKINNTNYIISFGSPIGDLAVGQSVYTNVNNVRTEFLIVHQGLPSSDYDASCNRTWVLMKQIYTKLVFQDRQTNDYETSNINNYLNNDFYELLEIKIRQAIQSIKLPYWKRSGKSGSEAIGSNGLLTKVFVLSGNEIGFNSSSDYDFSESIQIGKKLDYFETGTTSSSAKQKRIAQYNSNDYDWWLRTPSDRNVTSAATCDKDGTYWGLNYGLSSGVRPALVLSSTTLVDGNFNIIR